MAALSLIVLRAQDLARSRAFYEALGLVFTEEQHGDGPRHLSTTLDDGVVLELYPKKEDAAVDDVRLGIRVENVEHIVSNLVALGVHVKQGARCIVVIDPDGRKIEVT